ncbi:MAG: prolipoprotein diacylglyceryl transferase [Lachnospiraceae bacterium]|nr:prolipoprotein diacylglyceryl transferase [Lachnospiraceae bacterium]
MSDWMNGGDIAFPNLGIYLKDVPRSFTIFGFTIMLYGVIIAVGVLLAFMVISKVAKRDGQNPDDFYDMGIYTLIFGIIGARIYYVIFAWEYYKDDLLSIFNIRQGGLAIYGGVIAGVATVIIWSKIKKKNMFEMLDTAFHGVLVGQIMGRWGNFTNREVFGGYTDSLFAMRIPIEAVRSRDLTQELYANIPAGANYIQVHPTFLYESVCNLILLIIMLIYGKKKAFKGECTLLYLGGYGIIRFVIEGIRVDQLLIPGTHIPVSQLLGICLFIGALVADIVIRVKINKSKAVVEEKSAEASEKED